MLGVRRSKAVRFEYVSVDVDTFLHEAAAGLSLPAAETGRGGRGDDSKYAQPLYAGEFLGEDREEGCAVRVRERSTQGLSVEPAPFPPPIADRRSALTPFEPRWGRCRRGDVPRAEGQAMTLTRTTRRPASCTATLNSSARSKAAASGAATTAPAPCRRARFAGAAGRPYLRERRHDVGVRRANLRRGDLSPENRVTCGRATSERRVEP